MSNPGFPSRFQRFETELIRDVKKPSVWIVILIFLVIVFVITTIIFLVLWISSRNSVSTKKAEQNLIGSKQFFDLKLLPQNYLDSSTSFTELSSSFFNDSYNSFANSSGYVFFLSEHGYGLILKKIESSDLHQVVDVLIDVKSTSLNKPYKLKIKTGSSFASSDIASLTFYDTLFTPPDTYDITHEIKSNPDNLTMGTGNKYRFFLRETDGKPIIRTYSTSFSEKANETIVTKFTI